MDHDTPEKQARYERAILVDTVLLIVGGMIAITAAALLTVSLYLV